MTSPAPVTALPMFPIDKLLGSTKPTRGTDSMGMADYTIRQRFDKLVKLIQADREPCTVTVLEGGNVELNWGANNYACVFDIGREIEPGTYRSATTGKACPPPPAGSIADIKRAASPTPPTSKISTMHGKSLAELTTPPTPAAPSPVSLAAPTPALSTAQAVAAALGKPTDHKGTAKLAADLAKPDEPAPAAKPTPKPPIMVAVWPPSPKVTPPAAKEMARSTVAPAPAPVADPVAALANFAAQRNGTGFTKADAMSAKVLPAADWSAALSTLYRTKKLRRMPGTADVRHMAV